MNGITASEGFGQPRFGRRRSVLSGWRTAQERRNGLTDLLQRRAVRVVVPVIEVDRVDRARIDRQLCTLEADRHEDAAIGPTLASPRTQRDATEVGVQTTSTAFARSSAAAITSSNCSPWDTSASHQIFQPLACSAATNRSTRTLSARA